MEPDYETSGHHKKLKTHKHKKRKPEDLDADIHESEGYSVSPKKKKAKKHDRESPVATSEVDNIDETWTGSKKVKKKRMKHSKEHNQSLDSDPMEMIPDDPPHTELDRSRKIKKKKKKRKHEDDGQEGNVLSPSRTDTSNQSFTHTTHVDSEENIVVGKSPKRKKKKHRREHSDTIPRNILPSISESLSVNSELDVIDADHDTKVKKKKKKRGHKRSHSEGIVSGQLVEISEQAFLDEVNISGSDVRLSRVEHEISGSEGEAEEIPSIPAFLQREQLRERILSFSSSESEDEGQGTASEPGEKIKITLVDKFGTWTKQEDAQLTRNWKAFLKDYPMDEPYLMLNCRWSGKEEFNSELRHLRRDSNFVQRLATGLKRSERAAYNRARKLFHPGRDIRLVEKDLHLLKEYRTTTGHLAWAKMAQDLQVSGQRLIDFVRYIHRKEKGDRSKHWSEEDETCLVEAIVKVVGSYHHLDGIPWSEVVNHVPGKNDNQCRLHWVNSLYWRKVYGHERREFSSADKLELIKELRKNNIEDEFFIDWVEIRSKLNCQVPSMTSLKREWQKIKMMVPGFIMYDFPAILEWLDEYYVPKLEEEIASSEETTESSV